MPQITLNSNAIPVYSRPEIEAYVRQRCVGWEIMWESSPQVALVLQMTASFPGEAGNLNGVVDDTHSPMTSLDRAIIAILRLFEFEPRDPMIHRRHLDM